MSDPSRKTRNGPSRVRIASVFVRAVHLLAASAVLGTVLSGAGGRDAHGWWAAAAASGAALLVTEFLQHPTIHREGAGLATAAKLALAAAALALPTAAPWLLGAAFVVAALGAHAPRTIRHRRFC